MNEKRMFKWILISFLIIFAVMLLSGCKSTQYVPIETIKTEYIDRQYRDSIHITDSVYVREKGDTVWLTRWRTQYRDKLIRDSIIILDSIAVPYPIEVVHMIEKELNWFGKLRMWLGNSLILGAVGLGIWWLIKKKLKIK